VYEGFSEAVAEMVRVSRTFTPDAKNVRVYDRLYNEVYVKMYPTLSPLHRRIAEITGYPKSR
jgi:sugar (pentulose or hexulose) kinase